ncbi:sensor histidine kinase [Paenibacillus sp. NPDC056579]|uniref:sensor histidine kinase n=1 Tax=Paenibacillus sp. NPDC056579 TaxID=3345871 RepID=UPI0036AC55A6
MKIRTKLMLSMSILIVFIVMCLFFVTHVQFYIVRDLAYWDEKEVFTGLSQQFEEYYAAHGDSWEGLDRGMGVSTDRDAGAAAAAGTFGNERFFPEIALVHNEQLFYKKGRLELREMRDEAFPLFLKADGKPIGHLYVMSDRQLKTYEFKTMWYGIIPSIARVSLLLTGLVAMIIIFLLSWRLTSPIRKMIKGIDAIKRGDSEAAVFPVRRKDEFGAISRALRDMHESIESLERSRKQLMSDVAHELKTPLMIIQGELELAQELDRPVDQARIASLLDEVLRLTRLIHEVLELSKLEAGRMELRSAAENLADVAEGVIDKVRYLAEDKQIDISLHSPDEPVLAEIEKHRIVQALYNIVSNAIHYTEPGGRVRIGVERQYRADSRKEYALLTIEDTGIGIPAGDLPHIFNRFYRVDDSRTRHGGGTGLGLAIAQQNIMLHKGWIDVHSEVGRGTTFLVYLPMDRVMD